MATRSVTARLEEDLVERLDRLAAALSARAKGAEVSRSDALRVAATAGLDALEKEIAAERPPPKR